MNIFKSKYQQCWNGRNPNLKHYNENMSLFINIVSLISTTFCCGHHIQEAENISRKRKTLKLICTSTKGGKFVNYFHIVNLIIFT